MQSCLTNQPLNPENSNGIEFEFAKLTISACISKKVILTSICLLTHFHISTGLLECLDEQMPLSGHYVGAGAASDMQDLVLKG